MSEENPAVVIDNGSAQCKVGFTGDDCPRSYFHTVVGRSKWALSKETIVGNEAYSKKYALNLKYPMENRVVNNWNDMEKIWDYIFTNELRVAPENYDVLLTETPTESKVNREKMALIMFETFNVQSFQVAMSPLLSLYSSGRTYGIVVDSGDGGSCVFPAYEGQGLMENILRSDLAGRACTSYLVNILNGIGVSYSSSSEQEIASNIKEKLCYVALDYEEELQKYREGTDRNRDYELPDGNMIALHNSRIRCPELLFNFPGLHELALKSIMSCQIDFRQDLFGNVVLSGGSTMFPGMPERLSKELALRTPQQYRIKVVAPPERMFSVWIGGSILASLSTYQSQWITRKEYEEYGPNIVYKKCR